VLGVSMTTIRLVLTSKPTLLFAQARVSADGAARLREACEFASWSGADVFEGVTPPKKSVEYACRSRIISCELACVGQHALTQLSTQQ
jgi:hypothetical protein